MDPSDVEMMIKAILASTKDPISINELKRDYREANGEDIPFSKLGFKSLLNYLESIPDKVKLSFDSSGMAFVVPVIDSKIQQLTQLIKGQKRAKKKKSKSGTGRYRPPPTMMRFQPQSSTRRPFYNNNYEPRNNNYSNGRPSYQNITRTFDSSTFQNTTSITQQRRPDMANPTGAQTRTIQRFGVIQRTIYRELNLQPAGMEVKKFDTSRLGPVVKVQQSDTVMLDDVAEKWIDNAPYFLRVHEILILNFVEVDEIFFRLTNGDFSRQYTQLLDKMKSYYFENPKRYGKVEVNHVCVARKSNEFYRVYVTQVSDTSAHCCFLDEGIYEDVLKENLYPVQQEFLELKFQTIMGQLEGFDEFGKNAFIKDGLENILLEKNVIAKKTESKPLKMKIYEKGTDVCLNDKILQEYSHFKIPKLTAGTEFYGFVSFFDDRKKLTYIQIDDETRKSKLEEMTILFGEHFTTTARGKVVKFEEVQKDKLFCTKYSNDDNWYRVKVLKTPSEGEKKVIIDFVDFGNEETVPIESLREIPEKFHEQKHMPFQAIGVIVTELKNTSRTIVDFLDYDKPVLIIINSVNNKQIPYVTLDAGEDTRTNTDNESTDAGEDDIDEKETFDNKSEDEGEDENDRTMVQSETLTSICTVIENIKVTEKLKPEKETEDLISKLNSLSHLRNINYGIIEKLHYTQLEKTNLPPTSYVHVMSTDDVDPLNFKICLYEQKEKFDQLERDMADFYGSKHTSVVPESDLLQDHIYVYKSIQPQLRYQRVKFLELLIAGTAKLYNIDSGMFDISSTDCIYYISKRFTQLPMLALNAKLAFVQPDLVDKWSLKSKKYFSSLVVSNKIFRTSLVNYQIETDEWVIDLYDKNVSISKLLLAGNYAKSL